MFYSLCWDGPLHKGQSPVKDFSAARKWPGPFCCGAILSVLHRFATCFLCSVISWRLTHVIRIVVRPAQFIVCHNLSCRDKFLFWCSYKERSRTQTSALSAMISHNKRWTPGSKKMDIFKTLDTHCPKAMKKGEPTSMVSGFFSRGVSEPLPSSQECHFSGSFVMKPSITNQQKCPKLGFASDSASN